MAGLVAAIHVCFEMQGSVDARHNAPGMTIDTNRSTMRLRIAHTTSYRYEPAASGRDPDPADDARQP